MWGDVVSNARGNLLDSFIEDEELAVLNTGEPTHFHIQTGTFSAIDISLCSPDCYLDFTWNVMDELMGSDHFPIVIELVNDDISAPRSPRWILDKANWALFRTLTFLEVYADDFETVDDALDFLNDVIVKAGLEAIPRSSGKFARKPVPWWTIQCSITRKAMRAALTRYRRNPCDLYLLSYKKARARFRYQIKQAKRQSWIKYLSSINWRTTLPEVWSKIRKIAGKYVPPPLPVLKVNGLTLASPVEVSEAFADHFAKVSSKNVNLPYHHQRIHDESRNLDFSTSRSETYNLPFTMKEFLSALSSCHDSAPGPDDIPYAMIRHLPKETQSFLLSIINRIWKESYLPSTWDIAIMLPFLKPSKDG